MKYGFPGIKVSDLFQSGARATIPFHHVFSTTLPGLDREGMSGEILLENLNKSELLCTIQEATADFHTTCHRCGKEFTEKRVVKDAYIQAKITEKILPTEDLLGINPKDDMLYLEDFLVDCFCLAEPLKNLCESCKQEEIQEDDALFSLTSHTASGGIKRQNPPTL